MGSLRIGCICNPDAARNRRLLPSLGPALSSISKAIYVETKGSKDFSDILQAELVESLDLLILSGGDGTMQQGMSALIASRAERLPMLALLPAGSTNVASTDIGGRLGLAEAVAALTKSLPAPTTRTKQPLVIKPDEAQAPLAGFFLAIGAGPAAVGRYRKIRRPVRGMPFLDAGASVLAIGGTVMEIGLKGPDWEQVVSGELLVDGESTRIPESSLVLVTCLDGLFMGVSPWWGHGESPLKFLQLGLGAPSLMRSLPGILRGRPRDEVKASPLYAAGGAGTIKSPPVSKFTIDGELFRCQGEDVALNVRAGPEIEFVRLA